MIHLLILLGMLKYVLCAVLLVGYKHTAITMIKRKKKILLVDDEPDICLTIKQGLEDHGFDVDAYENPRESLRSFKPAVYDLVILDIKMPEIHGFRLYEQIRRIDVNVKVCFITASSEEYYRELFPELKKMECFMQKPILLDDLTNKINLVLANQ